MFQKDDNNNNLFDEIDDNEEEIKEEIIIDNNLDEEYNNENKKNQNFINTYDKFFIDSVSMNDLENRNEYHYMLKNQMINIIDDIKKKENEEQKNKNDIKKKIFKDLANKFINESEENNKEKNSIKEKENEYWIDNKLNINKKKEEKKLNNISYKDNNTQNININQYTLNPNKLQNMNNKQDFYNQNNNDNLFMENLQDLDKTDSQNNYIEKNQNENINEKNNKDNIIIKGNEKNKSIDINIKKNRGYLNNQDDMTESKEYNINIEDFLKENTMNDEDVVNNATNLLIDNSENGHNFNNNNKKYIDNKNIKYAVVGNPELKQKINENYDYFSQKNKNTTPINQQLTAKFNVLATRETYYKNNNDENTVNYKNYDKKSEIIYIDDCQTEEERKEKQKKFEERKQKKLKELEHKINHKRANSKPKQKYNNIVNKNNINDKQTDLNSDKKSGNNPIVLRPRTSKSKPMTYINNQNKNTHVAISAINKDETQSINIESNNKSNNIIKNKKPLRPMSTKSNNISHINKNNNTTLISNNTSHYSTLSRIPIKIEREESKIANKKVKNVHYSKMSNKKIIKKAINEVCLAGNSNKEYRDKINEIIDKCEFENYIILFRGNYGRFDIKAIYTYDIQNKNIEILVCIGNSPNFIDSSMVSTFYKYNVSANQFKELRGTKEFSCIVDGVCLRK